MVGGLLFVAESSELLVRLRGACLLLTVAWRHLQPGRLPRPGVSSFAFLGAAFTSCRRWWAASGR